MKHSGFIYSGASATAAIAVGYVAACFIPITVWQPVFPGLLVALSMLGAAVLVRLARNAPITAPTAFDDEDLKRFFDALEELNRRLFWIFIQAVGAILIVLFALMLTTYTGSFFGIGKAVKAMCSGFLGFTLVWLISRVVAMAKGDIGFVQLQRQVLENALARQRKETADKLSPASVVYRSPGNYGRALKN